MVQIKHVFSNSGSEGQLWTRWDASHFVAVFFFHIEYMRRGEITWIIVPGKKGREFIKV